MSTPIPQRDVSTISAADLPFPGGVLARARQSTRRPHLAFVLATFPNRNGGEAIVWTVNLQDLARCGAGHGFYNGEYYSFSAYPRSNGAGAISAASDACLKRERDG